jgi:hypothetical protein
MSPKVFRLGGCCGIFSLLLGFGTPTEVAAQKVRYTGRAVGEILPGNVSDEAHAGGLSAQGGSVDQVFCDESVECCFDQPLGCDGPTPSGSRTRGGAGEVVGATPGFPRVSSRVGALAIGIGTAIVSVSGVQAIADSDGDADGDGEDDGGIATSCGVITLTTDELTQEIVPELDLEVPVTESTVARCTRKVTNRDGFTRVEVDLFLLEPQPGGAQFLHANALAGVELPFTTGGAGCAVTRGTAGATELAGFLALLALRARRRGG